MRKKKSVLESSPTPPLHILNNTANRLDFRERKALFTNKYLNKYITWIYILLCILNLLLKNKFQVNEWALKNAYFFLLNENNIKLKTKSYRATHILQHNNK